MSNSRGNTTVAAVVSTFIVAAILVVIRVLVRLLPLKKAGLDDLFIVLALLFQFGSVIAICVEVQNGLGRHSDTLSLQETLGLLKAFWASVWLYSIAQPLVKISILFQYLRIFPHQAIRRLCWALLIASAAYGIEAALTGIFVCTPVSYFWTQYVSPDAAGHCVRRWTVYFAHAGINIALDFFIVLLPLRPLYKLQLATREKIALIGVFALGFFVCVVSVIRLQSLYVDSHTNDISYANAPAVSWSGAEVNVGIICASLPALKGAIQRYFPRFLSSTGSTTTPRHQDRSTVSGTSGTSGQSSRLSGLLPAGARKQSLMGWSVKQNDEAQSYAGRKHHSATRGETTSAGEDDHDLEMQPLDNDAAAFRKGKINVVTTLTREVHESSSSNTAAFDPQHDSLS